jgi:hypothetical protein
LGFTSFDHAAMFFQEAGNTDRDAVAAHPHPRRWQSASSLD